MEPRGRVKRASDLRRRAADARPTDVVVVGAGVAGLAAAVALAGDGASVTLLERRAFVGGRAYSYPHPTLGETIDSQHVVLGCCTNFLQLIEQAAAEWSIRWYDELCFLEPSAAGTPRRSWIRPGSLPAPAHQAVSFWRAPMLGLRDKAAIASGMARFLRGYPDERRGELRGLAQAHPPNRPRHPPLLGAHRHRRAQRQLRKLFREVRGQDISRGLSALATGRSPGHSHQANERVLRAGGKAGAPPGRRSAPEHGRGCNRAHAGGPMEGPHRRDGVGDRRSSACHRPPPHRAVDEHAGRRRRSARRVQTLRVRALRAPRPSPPSISGTTARSPTSTTRCCSTRASSGSSPSRASADGTRRSAATWSWSSAPRGRRSPCRASRFSRRRSARPSSSSPPFARRA